MTSAYRKVQQSTDHQPHIALTAHSTQVETEQNNSSSPNHNAFLPQSIAPENLHDLPELEASSVFFKYPKEGQGPDSTTHDPPFQTCTLVDDGDKDKTVEERSDPNGTVEVSALVHDKNSLTSDIFSRSPLARALQNAQSNSLLPSNSKIVGNMNTSNVSENSRGTERRTLYDFLPLNPMPLKSSTPALQRQKFWITPTEINVIGQNIQDISRHAVDAVHNTLTS